MKKLSKYLLTFIITFILGLIVFLISYWTVTSKTNEVIVEEVSEGFFVRIKLEIKKEDFWQKDESFAYKGFTVTNKCYEENVADFEQCKLRLIKNEKIIQEFVNSKEQPLKYGFFNFLGKKDKQLILYKGEGGSCFTHTYVIYDLQPKLRLIYDSRKFQKDRMYINFKLTPIDIDKDGVFEFTQSVHTFDYFYASHVDSIYPIAVFKYDKNAGKFRFANKEHSSYVIEKAKSEIEWIKQNPQGEVFGEKFLLRKKLLNLIYAGQRKKGWQLFESEYNFEDRKEFVEDLIKELNSCLLYQKIYKTR